MQGTIIVVDDNKGVLSAVKLLLKNSFERIITLTSPITLPAVLREENAQVVLLDMNFSSGLNTGNEGLYWLHEIKKMQPSLPVVLFTAYADIDLAVRGIKEGAADFIVKPWDNTRLVDTQEDIKEIVAYAAERQIMVVPEFDMPGHATAVCRAYPEYSGGGEGRWQHFTFHPCREGTYRFISDVLDEIVSLFPSPYIHIGGDEVHYGNQSWFTDPEIQNFIKEKKLVDEKGLEHYFLRRAADIVASKGKTMIGWDEIIDAGISPRKAVVMWWRHDRQHQLVKALENGYRVILTPRRPMYADFTQFGAHKVGRQWAGYNTIENLYNFPEPISHLMKGYENQVMGMQMSLWTERVADFKRLDFMVFPRLIALAEAAWTPEKAKECSMFMQRLPYFLKYLDSMDIYYFNPLNPTEREEPGAPEKEDVLQNG